MHSVNPTLSISKESELNPKSEKEIPDHYQNILEKDKVVKNENNHALFNKVKSTKIVKKKMLKNINNVVQPKTVKCIKESLNDYVSSNFDSEKLVLTGEGTCKLLLSCHLCRKEFKNAQNFKDHKCDKVSTVSTVKALKCKFCSLTFTQNNHLSKHMIGHKRNNCTFCNAQFTKRKALCRHLKTEHNIVEPVSIYKCSFCNKQFSKKPYLVEHLMSHANGQLVCYKCGFMCKSESLYTDHISEHVKHSKYECHLCGKKFVRRQQHDQHMMGHNRHSCSQCSITFSTKKMFLKHQLSVHGMRVMVTKTFICSLCKKKFLRPQQLRMHMRVHTGEKPLKCSHCETSFRNNRSLSKHMKSARHLQRVNIHEGKVVEIEKPYHCKECGVRFYWQQSLYRHIDMLHSVSEPWKCPHCEYTTRCKTNLTRHVEYHSDIRRFMCEICGLSFRALATLKEHHIFVHSEDRSFTCNVCDKSFKSKSMLQRHLKIHSESRPYKCHCNRDFKRLSHLKRHIASIHQITLKSKEANNMNLGINSIDSSLVEPMNLVISINNVNSSVVKSLDTLPNTVPPNDFPLLLLSNSNISSKLDTSDMNENMEDILSRTSKDDPYTNVPSTSMLNLQNKNNAHVISNNDPKSTLITLDSPPLSETPATPIQTNHDDSTSLDDPSLNLSPSNFCNFNLTSSPIAMENETSAIQDTITSHDILTFTSSTDSIIRPHSLPNLNFQNQPSGLDAFSQLLHSPDSSALEIPSFLLSGGISSPTHMSDLDLEQSASSKNFFGDSDDSLSLSPYACTPELSEVNCSSEHLFSTVRDIDLWDSGEHCNRLKLSSTELGTNDNYSTNLASSTTNILAHNMLFSNESLMVCALDSNTLNSDLDSLSNLC